MWELIEGLVYYLNSKKKRLPLFIVFLLIILAFAWSTIDPSKKVESVIPPVAVELLPKQHTEPKKSKAKPDHNLNKVDQEYNQPHDEKEIKQKGNVSHFKDSLTDTLKVEGLDPRVSEKIFSHMREQIGRSENLHPYDLEESIRIALPDADDAEVYRIKDLVSKAATESSQDYSIHNR
jgi:hypothetical protein